MAGKLSKERNIRKIQKFLRSVSSKAPGKRKQLVSEFLENLQVDDPAEIRSFYQEALEKNHRRRRAQLIVSTIIIIGGIFAVGFVGFLIWSNQNAQIADLQNQITELNLALFNSETQVTNLTGDLAERQATIDENNAEIQHLQTIVLDTIHSNAIEDLNGTLVGMKLNTSKMIALLEPDLPGSANCFALVENIGIYENSVVLRRGECAEPATLVWPIPEGLPSGKYEIFVYYLKNNPTIPANFSVQYLDQSFPLANNTVEISYGPVSRWVLVGSFEISQQIEPMSASINLQISETISENLRLSSMLIFLND